MRLPHKAILAVGVVAAATAALADSHVRIVRVSFETGGAETRLPPARWMPAMLNAPVVEGERIRTFADGRAEIQLECGSAIRLTPDTDLAAPVLALRSDGVRETTLRLDSGTLYATLQRGDARAFEVEVPGGTVRTPLDKVSLRIEVPADAEPGGGATVEVLEGKATVAVGPWTVPVEKHQRLRLGPGATKAFVAEAAPDRWSRWSHSRDIAFERALLAMQPQPAINAASSIPPSPGTASPATDSLGSLADPAGYFNGRDAAVGVTGANAGAAQLRRVPSCWH